MCVYGRSTSTAHMGCMWRWFCGKEIKNRVPNVKHALWLESFGFYGTQDTTISSIGASDFAQAKWNRTEWCEIVKRWDRRLGELGNVVCGAKWWRQKLTESETKKLNGFLDVNWCVYSILKFNYMDWFTEISLCGFRYPSHTFPNAPGAADGEWRSLCMCMQPMCVCEKQA